MQILDFSGTVKKLEKMLEVKSSNEEDIRSLIARVSTNTLSEFYDDVSEYRDGKAVLVEKNGKKVYVILQDPFHKDGVDSSHIRLDQWMRRRLEVEKGEEVTVKSTPFAFIKLFWGVMIFRHPNLNQRWENLGIFLAIIAFLIDFFLKLIEWSCSLEILSMYVIGAFLSFLFVPPLILVPRK